MSFNFYYCSVLLYNTIIDLRRWLQNIIKFLTLKCWTILYFVEKLHGEICFCLQQPVYKHFSLQVCENGSHVHKPPKLLSIPNVIGIM